MRPKALVYALVLLGACGGGGGAGVTVTLDEFSVRASPDRVGVGHHEFFVRNTGAVPHTFFVLRTGLAPDELPVADAEVDLEAAGIEIVARITEQIEAGGGLTVAVAADLRAGPHVLVCNVPGHYQSGMRSALDVVAD